jgi:pimeloyl-ACP methyl ester carboxylesterase
MIAEVRETEFLPGPPRCEVHHRYASINGVRLHYVEALPQPATANGSEMKLCLLLHGFPEFWYSWRHQIPALAGAGFRVLAPDLRGYNLSDKPFGVSAYRLDVLLEDVVGLIRHAGEERATVAGHDWGGVLAWHLPVSHPGAVEKLVVLNAPHPAAYRRELRGGKQLLRSWYVLFFQVPGLAEQVLGAGDYDLVARMLRRQPVHHGAFTPEDVERYKHALARPGALTAALNYYRALRYPETRAAHEEIHIRVPTLLLWGERDAYLSPSLTEGLSRWVPDLRVVRFPDASHWVQNDAAERVNRLMIDFLRGLPVPRVEVPTATSAHADRPADERAASLPVSI